MLCLKNGTVFLSVLLVPSLMMSVSDRIILETAIKKQDVKTILNRASQANLTAVEKRALIDKATVLADAQEKKNVLSVETKRSILAVGCLGLLAFSAAAVGGPILLSTVAPKKELLSFKYCLLASILSGIASGVAGYKTGVECEEGYYTYPHIYIRNYLSREFKMPIIYYHFGPNKAQ